jgi:hypothetical protein
MRWYRLPSLSSIEDSVDEIGIWAGSFIWVTLVEGKKTVRMMINSRSNLKHIRYVSLVTSRETDLLFTRQLRKTRSKVLNEASAKLFVDRAPSLVKCA